MQAINIRQMTVGDIEGVLIVEQQSFTTPWSRQAFEEEANNNLAHYLVVDDDGLIAGYAGMWVIIDEAHVTNVAISPDYRQKGLGEKLLNALIAQAIDKGATSMTLEVRASNTAAQKLYAKKGFTKQGLRPNYYTDTHEDALIMWKYGL